MYSWAKRINYVQDFFVWVCTRGKAVFSQDFYFGCVKLRRVSDEHRRRLVISLTDVCLFSPLHVFVRFFFFLERVRNEIILSHPLKTLLYFENPLPKSSFSEVLKMLCLYSQWAWPMSYKPISTGLVLCRNLIWLINYYPALGVRETPRDPEQFFQVLPITKDCRKVRVLSRRHLSFSGIQEATIELELQAQWIHTGLKPPNNSTAIRSHRVIPGYSLIGPVWLVFVK